MVNNNVNTLLKIVLYKNLININYANINPSYLKQNHITQRLFSIKYSLTIYDKKACMENPWPSYSFAYFDVFWSYCSSLL